MRTLVFLVGASGVGKTTVVRILADREPWLGNAHHFDSIGVPSPEDMETEFGGGEAWQRWATHRWVERLAETRADLQLIEGQTRPSFVFDAAADHPDLDVRVVLLDCSREVRAHRLRELRGAPHLDTADMDRWAAYLAGQAHALKLPVVDTSALEPDEVAAEVDRIVEGTSIPPPAW